ncbi:uncharacterized protein BDR25DRAFT_362591 [Lindgomyces ingoldianus]|uniref:Uncharacterized protein n=1 Tax=Lindgomyces ingoldianus TaxID=673940 RepID=A0ACB6Q9K3_9PLEO|nr:uncharacterized protein BDR25DRAFT_362591 [Lindgomyces ingoldianus]KAF2463591.1 hypothetical protein BDR25DRAFT_362591 [Lindgomyces ingoldianus]
MLIRLRFNNTKRHNFVYVPQQPNSSSKKERSGKTRKSNDPDQVQTRPSYRLSTPQALTPTEPSPLKIWMSRSLSPADELPHPWQTLKRTQNGWLKPMSAKPVSTFSNEPAMVRISADIHRIANREGGFDEGLSAVHTETRRYMHASVHEFLLPERTTEGF